MHAKVPDLIKKVHYSKEGYGIKIQTYAVIWSQTFISSQSKLREDVVNMLRWGAVLFLGGVRINLCDFRWGMYHFM